MRAKLALVAALLAMAASAPVVARPAARPAAAANWAQTFGVTPSGGFRMGNPRAKIAVVEYASLTCPHCKYFADTAVQPLVDQYVRTGKASYEFRPYVLDTLDLAANLVARCDGPARFFPMAADLYENQAIWRSRISDEDLEKLAELPRAELMAGVARQSGLILTATAHGIAPVKAEACLRSDQAATGLAAMRQSASALGVNGTPTIFVNGKRVAAYDWETLEPFLKSAGG